MSGLWYLSLAGNDEHTQHGYCESKLAHWLASTLHIEIFPRQVYTFSEMPAQVVPHDVTIICISAFLICSFAALIPAYFAARLDPVKALRYE